MKCGCLGLTGTFRDVMPFLRKILRCIPSKVSIVIEDRKHIFDSFNFFHFDICVYNAVGELRCVYG